MRPWIPALLLLLAQPAFAQSTPRSPFEGDARLDKKVTVRWKKAALYDALKELSKSTGVSLGPDRALVDEPVMASATDVPARQVLEQVGTLLHFTWVRSGGKPEAPAYLLFQDRAARQEEQDEIDGGRRAVLEALNKELDRYRRISRMPPGEFQREMDRANEELETAFSGGLASIGNNPRTAKRLQENMGLFAVGTPLGRVMVNALDGLTPAQWQRLIDERPVVLSSRPENGESQLPAGIQDGLRSATPQLPFPKSLFRALGPQVEQAIGQADKMLQEPWGKANGFKITIRMSLTTGSAPVGLLTVAPEPLGTDAVGPLFRAAGLNLMGAPGIFDEPKEDPEVRAKRLAADPVLGKKAKLELPPLQAQTGMLAILGQSYRVAEILPEIEKAYGVRLIGDAYNRLAMSVIPPQMGEKPLYELLDQVSGTSRDWDRDGLVIRLRSKSWAFDRRSEIPTRYMRRWLAERDKTGGFTLDAVAEIATMLRDEQVESLMFSAIECDAKDVSDFMLVSGNRDPLRLYGKLLPAQRRALLNGASIPTRSLFPYQQAAIVNLGNSKGVSAFSIFNAKPERQPELLAAAVLSLEVRRPEAPPQQQQPMGVVGGIIPQAATVHFLRLTFPDGQKDEYVIPLSRTTGAAPAGAPGEVPAPPPPPM